MPRCYFDGEECDCNSYDVAGDCPRDTYVHEDEFVDEDSIDDAYYSQPRGHDDEIERI